MPIYRKGNTFNDTGGGGFRDISSKLDRLVPKKRGRGGLKPAAAREAISESRAEALPIQVEGGTGGGGGITSPLTERDNVRTYHAPQFVYSSEGLFTWEYRSIATTIFDDGAANPLQINYDDPDT